jgi:DNA-binding Xre family transcriptional regulator
MKKLSIPIRYLPFRLSNNDKKKQINMLKRSKKLYKTKKYYTRKNLSSFHNHPSKHVLNARKIYKIDSIYPSKELSNATGCSLSALRKIVSKGEGAYYSSGSRPNQTAQSWGIARLASSITSGKAAAVDYDILEKGCNHHGKAFILAKKSRRKFGFGHSRTKKVHF